jgi:hypothetical protein
MHLKSLLATSGIALLGAQFTSALDADGWRNQSIYQLLTDRFSRDDSLNAPCDLVARQYCGGTWRGISKVSGSRFNPVALKLKCHTPTLFSRQAGLYTGASKV